MCIRDRFYTVPRAGRLQGVIQQIHQQGSQVYIGHGDFFRHLQLCFQLYAARLRVLPFIGQNGVHQQVFTNVVPPDVLYLLQQLLQISLRVLRRAVLQKARSGLQMVVHVVPQALHLTAILLHGLQIFALQQQGGLQQRPLPAQACLLYTSRPSSF